MPALLRRHLSIVLTTLACHAALAQGAPAGQPQLDLPRTTLTAGMHRIDAQLASTPAQRQIGLMHRKDMPAHEGMLFSFEEPGVQCFWMKNTLIPLDMIFLDPAGRVSRVKSMAAPGDLTPVDGGTGVQFVLEINAGLAGKLGIAPGTVLRHPAIPAATAAWPCNG